MKSFSATRLFFGLLLILLGFGFLMDQFGPFSFGWVFANWWPMILVAIGVMIFMRNPSRIFPGLFMIFIGALLQISQLGLLPFSVWSLWPLFLVFLGVATLLRPQRQWEEWWDRNDMSEVADKSDHIDENIFFSSTGKRITSEKFNGGKVSVAFGEYKLDLREAKLTEDATLHVDVSFGSMKVMLPKDMRVSKKIDVVAGNFENRAYSNDSAKVLRIEGNVSFGDMKVS